MENIYNNNIEIPNKNTYDKEYKKEINKTDGKWQKILSQTIENI